MKHQHGQRAAEPESVIAAAREIIVRFSEITLKGRNRGQFEKQMARNAALHLKAHGSWRLVRRHARLTLWNEAGSGSGSASGTGSGAGSGAEMERAVDILRGLPGIANVSMARGVPREPEPLKEEVVGLVREILERKGADSVHSLSFRMEVSRKDKRYQPGSMEMAAMLGAAVLEHFPELKVDLTRPDFTVMVEIHSRGALLFEEKIQGPGGLAVGSSGKAVCLMSGGIDSPVAAYLMMTRGCPVVYLNFHSPPFIGERSKEKVRQLVRFLARYQPFSRLYVAPFAEFQQAIRDRCPEGLRTILYRRAMNRVANEVARREGALALVTGEAVGQVASQTMENIRVIQETAEFPVMQPLIGLSKREIVERARSIGTFEISIQPHPDCCTLFQPRRPETRAKIDKVRRAEEALPLEELVEQCLNGLEITDYGPEYYPAKW